MTRLLMHIGRSPERTGMSLCLTRCVRHCLRRSVSLPIDGFSISQAVLPLLALNPACMHALRNRAAQVSLEEICEVREGLAATCGTDEQMPPPPLPQMPPPPAPPHWSPPPAPSTGQRLMLQRALNPVAAAVAAAAGPTAVPGGCPPAGPLLRGVMRKWKSSLPSSAAATAAAAVAAASLPPFARLSGGAGNTSRVYRLTSNDDPVPSGLLLALMSGSSALGLSGNLPNALMSMTGVSEGSSTTNAAAAAVIGLLSRTGSSAEDAEVQRSLLEMLVGRRTQTSVSVKSVKGSDT